MVEALINKTDVTSNETLASHGAWLNELYAKYPKADKDNARAIIEQEIGKVFLEVLKDAGVFKRTEAGMIAFARFVATL